MKHCEKKKFSNARGITPADLESSIIVNDLPEPEHPYAMAVKFIEDSTNFRTDESYNSACDGPNIRLQGYPLTCGTVSPTHLIHMTSATKSNSNFDLRIAWTYILNIWSKEILLLTNEVTEFLILLLLQIKKINFIEKCKQ